MACPSPPQGALGALPDDGDDPCEVLVGVVKPNRVADATTPAGECLFAAPGDEHEAKSATTASDP
jgi:hypothetical protein